MGNLTTSDNKLINEGDALRDVEGAIKENTDGGYYIEVIDTLHQTVHQKKMHTISITDESVVDGGSSFVRIVAGLNKDIHTRIAFSGEGKTRLKSYIGTTYTDDGTPFIPFNRQTASPNTLEALVYTNPTIDVLGTLRGNDFLGSGGATAGRAGGTGSADIETIINAGTELLIELVNNRGSASDLGLIINLYERAKFE